jgi:Tol biopolymer transport system component
MNSLEAHALADTEDATFPFWSPDSRSLGFFAESKLKTIELSGGSVQAVCDAPLGRGGAWGAGGVIVFSPQPSAPILRVSASGGNPVAVTKVDAEQFTSHRWPYFLPDGKHFLYLAIHHEHSKAANNTLYYASLDGRENVPLFRSQSNAIYAGGFLLFGRGNQLVAQAFNPGKGTLSGEPQSVAKGVMNDANTWHMDASASDDGLLVFGSGGNADLQLVWMDREGKQVSPIGDKFNNLTSAVLSPQGDRVALQIDTGENDIWILDLTRGVRTRLTFGPIANIGPVWSPDGKWIAYTSARPNGFNLYRKPSDGSGAEELLVTGDMQQITASNWSRDGKYIFYSHAVAGGANREIWVVPPEGERKPRLVVARGGDARLSPNGHWLAYQSSESGVVQVYVVAFGGGQGKWQVSSNGGQQARWSEDGKELYYIDPAYNIFAVPVKDAGSALQFGAAQTLVNNWSAPQVFYDVSPDGKRILLDRVSQQVSQAVTVVTNFAAGLKR